MKARLAASDKRLDDLRGKAVINLFFEPSTRTRASFELAARRLSADLLTMTPQASSLTKGESLQDMVENLEAMGPRLLIVRHGASGVPGLISRHTKASVINAGDGSHEHPTQALLDVFTVGESLKISDWKDLSGLNVVIVGDLAYSRVARSNLFAFRKLGARVTCVGPATLLPPGLESLGARVATDFDRELPNADVVMLLRIQKERQEKLNFPSLAEYTRFYGLTKARHARMKPEALIMHPGPINRGVEIDPDVADGTVPGGARTVILDQVHHGVPVRMAVLSLWGQNP
jgi:aspartate carbamoyltransferase catalytic subunit